MQTEFGFAGKLSNNAVAYRQIFLHDISIFDIDFTTGPLASGGKVVEKFSSAEEDADPGPPLL
jgi:hypothetical protein